MDLLIEYFIIALSSVLAVIAVKMIYFKVLVLAKSKNLVDNPDARKLQKRPVPILGGLLSISVSSLPRSWAVQP